MREENIFENKKIEFTESLFKDKTNILIDTLKQKINRRNRKYNEIKSWLTN